MFVILYGAISNYLDSRAFKKELEEVSKLANQVLERKKQQREAAPVLDIPLQPKGTDSGTFTAKHETNTPHGDANMPDMDYTVTTFDPETTINISTYRYESGMYQGMTYAEAYFAWKAKKDEIYKRFHANLDKSRELARAAVDSSKAESSTMLSFLKNLSPKDLADAEEELIKAYPKEAEKLQSFFKDIANATPKSLDEISKDAEFILKSRGTNWIATKQTHAEFTKIVSELDQVETEKPIMPNLQ